MKWLNGLSSLRLKETGIIVHFTEDEYGKILVIDNAKYRLLNFNSPFEQSVIDTQRPLKLVHQYTQYMMLVLALIEPENVTLLGLGGGSLLRTLHYLLPNCNFDAVELRQKVVDIAVEYFQIPTDKRVSISVLDAAIFVREMGNNSTDIIFSDMYLAYEMIEDQTQLDFLKQCSRVLTSNGWLVINISRLPKNKELFFASFFKIFPTILVHPNTDNTILFASNSKTAAMHLDPSRITSIEHALDQAFNHLLTHIRRLRSTPTQNALF